MTEGAPVRRPLPPVWVFLAAGSLLVAGVGSGSLLDLLGRLWAPIALVLLYRVDPRWAILAGIAGVTLRVVFTGELGESLQTALPVAVSGLILARAVKIGLRPILAISEASLPYLLVAVFLFANPPVGEERELIVEGLVAASLTSNQGLARDADTIAFMERFSRTLVEGMLTIAPAALYLWLSALTTFVYGVMSTTLGRLGIGGVALAPFSSWRVPFGFVWFLAVGLSLVLAGRGAVQDVGWNVAFFAMAVFFAQGLAMLAWNFRRRQVALWQRVLFYMAAILLVPPFFLGATALMGLLDTWFDFRRLENEPDPRSGGDRESEG